MYMHIHMYIYVYRYNLVYLYIRESYPNKFFFSCQWRCRRRVSNTVEALPKARGELGRGGTRRKGLSDRGNAKFLGLDEQKKTDDKRSFYQNVLPFYLNSSFILYDLIYTLSKLYGVSY